MDINMPTILPTASTRPTESPNTRHCLPIHHYTPESTLPLPKFSEFLAKHQDRNPVSFQPLPLPTYHVNGPVCPSSTAISSSETGDTTKRRERWTKEEHERFLEGLETYGRKWKKIQTFVKSKTAVQVRTHAYGYFAKLLRNMPEHVRWNSSERIPSPIPIDRRGFDILQKHVLSKRRPADEKRKAQTSMPVSDLASTRFHGKIIFATDEWFAIAENMLHPEEPVFFPEKFTTFGKWMDGWETRRKRIEGHDWCIIQLGLPGSIHGIDVDTAFFTGNNAPRFSLQAACLTTEVVENIVQQMQLPPGEMGTCATRQDLKLIQQLQSEKWTELVPFTKLGHGYPDTRHNYFDVANTSRWTHLRLNIYPDGGVARLRVYGHVSIDWNQIAPTTVLDLAAATNGGRAIACSDKHYGEPKNLIGPGRAINMGDGWETKRKTDRPPILQLGPNNLLQVPGHDWAIIKLGTIGYITQIEVDTLHFKGNFPESCLIEACHLTASDDSIVTSNISWEPLVPRTKLQAHQQHYFTIQSSKPWNFIRITIYPDGGISRLRVYGTKAVSSRL